MTGLEAELRSILDSSLCDEETYRRFAQRIGEGGLTRDDDPASHVGVYFLVHDAAACKVLIVHHKKSGLWLSPGGHVENGETLRDALHREVAEELGVHAPALDTAPFFLSVCRVANPGYACREHLDVWFRMRWNGERLHAMEAEFHDVRWVRADEARAFVTDVANLRAIDRTLGRSLWA